MTAALREKWFAQLASLTYPASPGQAAEAFKPYLPMLAHLPAGAFTHRSLEHVVCAPRKMAIPSYDEVAKPLGAWWRENRPFMPALPAPQEPDRIPPTEEVKRIVSALAAEARGVLATAIDAKKSAPSAPVRPCFTSDGYLLTLYEAQAAAGGPMAGPAAIRADMLRAKLLKQADRELERS